MPGDRIANLAVSGTPADCAIMGVRHLLADKLPDLMLSGVNRGQNIADDVTYSGTIAGALEGMMLGVPSMALSLATNFSRPETIKWETARLLGPRIVRNLMAAGVPNDIVVNINFPDREPDDVAGLKVCRQGRRDQNLISVVERTDMRGHSYFWYGFDRHRSKPAEDTDLWAIYNGYVSVTPLHLDLTSPATLADMQDRDLLGE